MTFRCAVREKTNGVMRQINPGKVDAFFRAIESVTGLDRPIAEATLHSGRHIDHPHYEFVAEPINPFDPVRLA